MNRINICKNIIQSIRDYITNPDNLDAYREKIASSVSGNYRFFM